MKKIIVAVMAVIFGYSIAKADIVLVPDFRVDQDPTPNQISDVASSIAYGYFVVIYRYTGNNYTLMARRFDLSGNPLGNAFQVNSTPSTASVVGAGVAIDSNGNMVFVWSDDRTGQFQVYFRRFNITENPLEIDTDISLSPYAIGIQVAALTGGGFVCIYQTVFDDYDVYARIYNSSGVTIGNEFRVDQNPDVNNSYGASSMPVVASSGNRIYFAWVDARDGGNITFDANIYARVFDTSGNPIGNDFRVDQIPPFVGCFIMISMAAAPNGNFIVAYSDNRVSGGDCMNTNTSFSRAMDSSGAFIGSEVDLFDGDYDLDLSCAPSGRCLVIGFDSFARHLNSNGDPVDAQFKISSTFSAEKSAPVANNSYVTAGGSGSIQVWANITGPDPSIPTLSNYLLIILSILLLSILLFFSKTRKIGDVYVFSF